MPRGLSDTSEPNDVCHFDLTYPDGPQLLLTARLGFCGDFGISNGRRSGQLAGPLMELLCDTVGCYRSADGDLAPVR